jgi:hypothetical protein
MAINLIYTDAYLCKFCTEDRETRAYAAVDALGTFTTTWRDQLAVVKCYEIACIENQADPEDLFTAKQKIYEKEFTKLLSQARTAAEDDDGNVASVFSILVERG